MKRSIFVFLILVFVCGNVAFPESKPRVSVFSGYAGYADYAAFKDSDERYFLDAIRLSAMTSFRDEMTNAEWVDGDYKPIADTENDIRFAVQKAKVQYAIGVFISCESKTVFRYRLELRNGAGDKLTNISGVFYESISPETIQSFYISARSMMKALNRQMTGNAGKPAGLSVVVTNTVVLTNLIVVSENQTNLVPFETATKPVLPLKPFTVMGDYQNLTFFNVATANVLDRNSKPDTILMLAEGLNFIKIVPLSTTLYPYRNIALTINYDHLNESNNMIVVKDLLKRNPVFDLYIQIGKSVIMEFNPLSINYRLSNPCDLGRFGIRLPISEFSKVDIAFGVADYPDSILKIIEEEFFLNLRSFYSTSSTGFFLGYEQCIIPELQGPFDYLCYWYADIGGGAFAEDTAFFTAEAGFGFRFVPALSTKIGLSSKIYCYDQITAFSISLDVSIDIYVPIYISMGDYTDSI